MLPTNYIELMTWLFLVFVGTIFVGILIGEISSILSAYTRIEREKNEEFDMVNTVMVNLKINDNLKTRVLEYYDELKKASFIDSPEMYKVLPKSLWDLIKEFQIYSTVRKLNFINITNQIQIFKLVKHIQIWYYLSGEVILKQGKIRELILGSTNSNFYFVHQGMLEVIIEKRDFDYFCIEDSEKYFSTIFEQTNQTKSIKQQITNIPVFIQILLFIAK